MGPIWAVTLPKTKYRQCTYNVTLRSVLSNTVAVKVQKVLNIVLFGPRRDEVTGDWRKLHNEELNDLYSSPNIVRVIKSRRMRWAGHVARMGEEMGMYRVLVGETGGKETTGET